jgi:hypothetical protein
MTDFERALFGKCFFPSEKVLRPNASEMRGIRLGYPDGTRAIFWFNDKKYFIRVEVLGAIFSVKVPKDIAEGFLEDFYAQYGSLTNYEDV